MFVFVTFHITRHERASHIHHNLCSVSRSSAAPDAKNQTLRNWLKWETTGHFQSSLSPPFLRWPLQPSSRESESHFPQHAPSLMCFQYSLADANAVKMTLETISLWRWRYAVLGLTLLPLVSSILTRLSRRTFTPHPYRQSVLSCRQSKNAKALILCTRLGFFFFTYSTCVFTLYFQSRRYKHHLTSRDHH